MFQIGSSGGDNTRFAVVVLVSLVLHAMLFFAFLNLRMFDRKLVDPDRIYHVNLMNLQDLPIGLRNRMGGPQGGGGNRGRVKPTAPEPGPLPRLVPDREAPAAEPPLEAPLEVPEIPLPKPEAAPVKPGTDQATSASELRVPVKTKGKKKPAVPREVPPSFESRWTAQDAEPGGSAQAVETLGDDAYQFEGLGSGGGGTSGSIALDNADFQFYFYLTLIKDKIGHNWNQPSGAGKPGESGRVIIYFRIHRDGRVSMIEIEEGSGIALLDHSALRAVQAAAPFPPLPREFGDDSLGVHFGFDCTF
ncbi:energy transducer TonB [bacterium]|nr:energy transducer TonB [candidate division CSSED10-310 bacterium]